VPEQRHQCLQRAAGVDERGRVGVAELVRGDVAEAGRFGGAGELVAQRAGGDALAVVGEQEVDRAA